MEIIPSDIDAVLITSWVNRKYFTGLKTTDGVLLLTREKSYLIVDFRYIEIAQKCVKNLVIIEQRKMSEQLRLIEKEHNLKKIGIESGYLSVKDYIKFQAIFSNAELVFDNRVNCLLENMRKIKSPDEVECIKYAQCYAERAFYDILEFIKPGRTEREIAARLDYVMKGSGSNSEAFQTIVAAGKNTSMPHATPTDNQVKNGDFVIMDFGATFDCYCSDMTRTVAVGSITDEMKKVYQTVLTAQNEAIATIQNGVLCSDVDKVARNIITDAGYGKNFGHSLGHSLGIEIHEKPFFLPNSAISHCKIGHIMTVEPGIYLQGNFGVRIEDMIYIGENGVMNLTKSEKQLITL
ncbi:MAG: aminopeptidase P family protein [Oscillospiraceae bacterium]